MADTTPAAPPQGSTGSNPTSVQMTDPTNTAYSMQGILSPQSMSQQAAAFQNPYASLQQAQINAIPTQLDPNQTTATQLGSVPLAALTSLGQVGQAGLATAGPTTISQAQSNPLLQAQLQQINQLNNQAQGIGPSVAQVQAQQQAQQNIANQMALIGSQRGSSNPALGQRSAQIAAMQANQQAVQAGVLGRTQEELSAQQQLTGALQGTQGQVMQGAQAQGTLDANTSALNAQLANTQQQYNAGQQNAAMLQQGTMTQQSNLANAAAQQQGQLANLQATYSANLANLQAAQQTQGLDVQEYNNMVQAQSGLANTNLAASQNYAQLVANQQQQAAAISQKVSESSTANMMGLEGAGIGAGGTAVAAGVSAASDINLKTNIKPGARSVKDFLKSFSAKPSSTFALLESI